MLIVFSKNSLKHQEICNFPLTESEPHRKLNLFEIKLGNGYENPTRGNHTRITHAIKIKNRV